jgi:hypothetical protein
MDTQQKCSTNNFDTNKCTISTPGESSTGVAQDPLVSQPYPTPAASFIRCA